MQLGRFRIEQLNEGQFEFFKDGKINRTPVSEAAEHNPLPRSGQSLVGINPLYITDGTDHILLDAGLGWGLDSGSANTNVSNIRTNLKIFGVKPADITHVILTHLHYDHAAGISYTNKAAKTCTTLPNAIYFVQQVEWEYALQQVQLQSNHSTFYKLDELYRLYAEHAFKFIDEKVTEIIPGIRVIKTGGHTPGHQIVKIFDKENIAYFWGDLVPTPRDLNYFSVTNCDVNRVQVKKMKVELLRTAYREKAFLFFYHAVHSRVGQLDKDKDKNYILKEI